jgi:catechol 2,3-dioxygenase-like lactoylglutathione lyase family enzyme
MQFNRLVPELNVSNIEVSLDFYVNKLGFKIEFDRIEDRFAYLSFEGSQLMLEEDNEGWVTGLLAYPRGRGINFQIETDDLFSIELKVKSSEIPFFRAIMENWYRIAPDKEEGVKEFLIQDPDGYLLRFQQFLGEREITIN